MFRLLNRRLRRLCSRFPWPIRRTSNSNAEILINRLGNLNSRPRPRTNIDPATVHPNTQLGEEKPIKIATFNAALFSMAPAVPPTDTFVHSGLEDDDDFADATRSMHTTNLRTKSVNDRPKSILKPSPFHPSKPQRFAKSRLRVSINLPDNEISLLRNRQLSFREGEEDPSRVNNISRILRGKAPMRSQSLSFARNMGHGTAGVEGESYRSTRTVLQVLKELDPDILALQDVKAEEEKAMKPLSDLAAALGMNYVFAESWAPEYGNAILSKWPIKTWKVQKIFDDTDFRNVLKATIEVPQAGEVNFHCTHLDHLDENWRMKQIDAIIHSNDHVPHILAGGLNSLDETDYSDERWADIVKYFEEMGKPTPQVEVMRFLRNNVHYTDAKDFAGECESVVVIAKGQSVQGTCKYGTRVDYILASANSPYKFVPGSYSVVSSKGTSDHHIVKADIIKSSTTTSSCHQQNVIATKKRVKPKHSFKDNQH